MGEEGCGIFPLAMCIQEKQTESKTVERLHATNLGYTARETVGAAGADNTKTRRNGICDEGLDWIGLD